MLLASARHSPHLYKGVILVDSPLFRPALRRALSLVFMTPDRLIAKMHPLVKSAAAKRDKWPDRSSAQEWMSENRLFKTFSPEFRSSFIQHGLMESSGGEGGDGDGDGGGPSSSSSSSSSDGGVTLAFTKRQEENMYLTTPTETGLGPNGGVVGMYGKGGFPVLSEAARASGLKDPKGVLFYSLKYKLLRKDDAAFLKSPKGLGRREDGLDIATHGGGCEFKAFDHEHFWPQTHPEDFGTKMAAAVKALEEK